mgnify:CR=1 FL=1
MVQPAEEAIRVEVEPQNSEVRIPITQEMAVEDVIEAIKQACRDNPDVDLGIWARQRVGSGTPTWRLFRKGQNNQVLAPRQRIVELDPPLTHDEEFVFDVEPVVG